MIHSSYVAPRMQTWAESGQKAIRHLMAKMGIPKREFEETFFRKSNRLLAVTGLRSEFASGLGKGRVRGESDLCPQ